MEQFVSGTVMKGVVLCRHIGSSSEELSSMILSCIFRYYCCRVLSYSPKCIVRCQPQRPCDSY